MARTIFASTTTSSLWLRLLLHLSAMLVAVSVSVVAGLAHADDELTPAEDRARAESRELFKQGKNAFKAGDYDAAQDLFQRAWARWDREPLIALALAKAYDRANLTEKALIYYEHFLRLAPITKDYAQDREQTVVRLGQIKEALNARPGTLRFKGLPSGAVLEVDGRPCDVDAAGDLKVSVGTHSVKVKMDNRLPFNRPAVAVGPGEVKVIEVVMVAPVDPTTLPRDHKWTWRAGMAATAGLVTSAVFGLMWLNKYGAYSAQFDVRTGQPNEATKAAYQVPDTSSPTGMRACDIGQKLPNGQFECQKAVDAGNALLASSGRWQIASLSAAGLTAALGILTYMAYLDAPVADPNKAPAKAALSLRLLPLWSPTDAGLALHLDF